MSITLVRLELTSLSQLRQWSLPPSPFRSIRTSSSRRSSRTEQQRRKEVSQGFSNECPAFLLAQLDVYLYEELLREGKEYRRGGRKGEGRRIDGRNCQLSGWPDGQLFGREMRKFVHSGEGEEKSVIFSGVESCDSDVR